LPFLSTSHNSIFNVFAFLAIPYNFAPPVVW
jgi:hypothetical protein